MDVYKQLRKKFDGADSFVAGGHTVGGKPGTLHAERVANTPEWVNDDKQVRSLLLRVFPKLETDEKQRARAAKWIRFIYLYFRVGWTITRISLELGISYHATERLRHRVSCTAKGKRSDRSKLRGIKPRGRPKKNDGGIPAPIGNSGDDSHISL